MIKPIPEGSIEVQTGLWAYWYTFTVSGTTYGRYEIYSSEGYCFWSALQPENYDAEGNLVPLDQRIFAQYAATTCQTIEEVNSTFFSVPIQEGYEIVGARPTHETA